MTQEIRIRGREFLWVLLGHVDGHCKHTCNVYLIGDEFFSGWHDELQREGPGRSETIIWINISRLVKMW